MGFFQILIFIVWALSALALVALVLMHSGKGTGISDMIASSLYNANAATGIMERNLDRLTVIVAVVFAVCVLLCMFFFPQGGIVGVDVI
ncbi:preprotein translocase subunit SecG [Enorma sp.]|jgi:preprotein translocase subunit SecG|uniref:preprotein translocase subunit SecG n=1 Tax=Enorma sp. TaxID=1920692 RepID=UPI0025C15C83|nr:preprotein translocase subunit SecG [Enorma sp.]